jgi:hypothetical protein
MGVSAGAGAKVTGSDRQTCEMVEETKAIGASQCLGCTLSLCTTLGFIVGQAGGAGGLSLRVVLALVASVCHRRLCVGERVDGWFVEFLLSVANIAILNPLSGCAPAGAGALPWLAGVLMVG